MNRFESYSKRLMWLITIVLTGFVAGCGGGGGGGGTVSNGSTPANAAGVVCDKAVLPACVDLKTAGTYVILAQTGTTNIPTSAITGNIGTSPAVSTATTAFSETMDASGTFATSSQVTGKMFASNYAAPTPANLNTAVNDSINTSSMNEYLLESRRRTPQPSHLYARHLYLGHECDHSNGSHP
jgi:hypothetical protein